MGAPVPCIQCHAPLVKLPLVKAYKSEVTLEHVTPRQTDYRCPACGLEGPQK